MRAVAAAVMAALVSAQPCAGFGEDAGFTFDKQNNVIQSSKVKGMQRSARRATARRYLFVLP